MSSNREDGETDIYGDLPNFQFDDAFKKLEQDKAYLQNKVEVLGVKLEEMKKENEKLAAKVKALGKNISCLYKTAQREIERKEKIIADLRKERDDLLFRRGLHDSKPSYTRPSRKQLTPTKKVRNGSIRRIFESKGKAEVVHDGSITPSPEEYENICPSASAASEKPKIVNNKVSLTAEIVHLSDSESNTECPVVKPAEQVENMKSQVLNSNTYTEARDSEKRVPSPLYIDEIVNKTGRKETTVHADNSSVIPELHGEDGASNASSNNRTYDEGVKKEIPTSESSPVPLVTLEEGKSASPSSSTRQSDVTTPKKDKISVHMSSEDCGFGRRRVRRVIKPSLSPVTSVTTAQEERGIKRPLEGTLDTGPASCSWRKPKLLAVEVMQADPRAQKRRCMDGSQAGNHHDSVVGKSDDGRGFASEKSGAINGADSSCQENSGDLLVISYGATKSKEINGVCDPLTSDIVRQREGIDKCENINEQGSYDQKHTRMLDTTLKNYSSSFGVSAFGSSTTNTACSTDHNCLDESDVSRVTKPKVIASRCRSSIEEDCIVNKVKENQCGSTPPHLSPTPSYGSDYRSPVRSPSGSRMMTDDELSSRRSWDRERVSRPSVHDRKERYSGEVVKSGYMKSCSQMDKGDLEVAGGQTHSGMRGEKIRRDCGRAHLLTEKNGGHERGVSGRSRDHNRERSGDFVRDRGRSRDRHARGRSREWSRDRHTRGRSREWSRDRHTRGRSREWSRDRHPRGGRSRDREGRRRSVEWSRERSGDGERRSRDGERRRSRDCDSDKSGGYDRERDRSRDEERERENRNQDRLRDVERSKECDRREPDRFRCVNRGRDSYGRRDVDKGQDHERSKDSDRYRETSGGSKDSDKWSSGRSLEGRKLYDCRSREGSPGRAGGKEPYQSKSDGRSSTSKLDLREKLNDSLTDEGGGKQMNGYKDWDRPASDDDERNVRWCARKANTRDVGMIKSPQRSSNQRECHRPSTPEWD